MNKLYRPLTYLRIAFYTSILLTFRIYGFYDECKRKYSVKLWKCFVDVFNCLPVGKKKFLFFFWYQYACFITYKYSCLFCLVKLYSAFCMAIYYTVGQKMEMIISPCVGERGKNEKSRNFGTTNIIRRLILIIINKAVFRTA